MIVTSKPICVHGPTLKMMYLIGPEHRDQQGHLQQVQQMTIRKEIVNIYTYIFALILICHPLLCLQKNRKNIIYFLCLLKKKKHLHLFFKVIHSLVCKQKHHPFFCLQKKSSSIPFFANKKIIHSFVCKKKIIHLFANKKVINSFVCKQKSPPFH